MVYYYTKATEIRTALPQSDTKVFKDECLRMRIQHYASLTPPSEIAKGGQGMRAQFATAGISQLRDNSVTVVGVTIILASSNGY